MPAQSKRARELQADDSHRADKIMHYEGKGLSWKTADGVAELALHHPPANEIGTVLLEELERFAEALPALESQASALVIYSEQEAGFSSGADLLDSQSQHSANETIQFIRCGLGFAAGCVHLFQCGRVCGG